MKPYGFIYITTNLVNKKQYIGQCALHRKCWKTYLGSGKALKRAIKKYRIENFSREIICYCFSKHDMNFIEELIIKEYDAVLDRNFYNIIAKATATNGFKGKKHTKEWKEARREFGRTRPATDKMRENMRKLGKAPRTEKQIAASKKQATKMGKANTKPKIYKKYICPMCKSSFERFEYEHHMVRKGLCCSQKCAGVKSVTNRKNIRMVQINGKIFNHAKEAAEELDINYYTIIGRIKSDNFDEYIYVKEGGKL